jgi:hypothetical protein
MLGAAGDAHGLVADALEVTVDLDDGQDEAQVDGHGLLLGQEFIGHLVQFALGGVDGRLVLFDILAQALVTLKVRVYRGLDGLLRQGSHGKDLVLEFGELLLKVNTRHDGFSLINDCASRNVTSVRILGQEI